MARFALGVEYDGSQYHGWQRQQNAPSVQACVETALARVANHPVTVVCAGRTDCGVHALQQVIHFDTSQTRTMSAWVRGTNSYLPADISIVWAREVSDDFHARFCAISRSYRYLIANQTVHSVTLRRITTHYPYPLCAERMHTAAQWLVGEHDFSAYRASECQAQHARRCVQMIRVSRQGFIITVDITANAFLHHMVRNIVGVLLEIGQGRQDGEFAKRVLEGRDRSKGAVTAPAQGLFLVAVEYPEYYGLPAAVNILR